MAEEKKFPSVSEAEKQGKGVGALADRPNLAATYGQGGLTAAELKKWFDGLASLIIDKYNLLGAEMQSGAATEYIGVPEDAAFPEGSASTLKDVLTGIVSGALAQYLVAAVTEDASGKSITTTLSQFVVEARGNIGANYSEIMATKGRVTTAEGDIDSLEGRAKSLEDRATTLEGRATSLEGRVTPVESRMTAAESDIDSLEERATSLEGRANGFESSFVTTDGRLTSLEGRASTAESNISYIKGKLASFGLLKNVVFDESTDKLTFTFVVGDTTKQITISLADFIDSAELSSQISEKVSALAKAYVDQAKESAATAESARNEARIHGDRALSYSSQAEASAQRAATSASEAKTAKETADNAAESSLSSATAASDYASQAKASADKAEMYSQTSEDRWSVFDKRLTNVENGISADPFVTDDTVAYQKTVPASALPFAAIERVGGMSYVSRNLFNIDATPTWNTNTRNTLTKVDEVTFTSTNSNNDGGGNGIYIGTFDAGVTITVSGYFKTSPSTMGFVDVVTPKSGSGNLIKEYGGRAEFTYFQHTYTTKDTTREYYYRPAYAQTYIASDSVTLKNVQIEIGSTATTYMPYFAGIRHAAVTAIESTGKNLFDNRGIDYTAGIGLNFQTYGEYIRINGTKVAGANIVPVSKPNLVLSAGTYALSVRFISGTLTRVDTSVTDDTIMFGINSSGYAHRTAGACFKVGDVGTRIFTITEPLTVSTFDITCGYSGTGNVYDNVVVACQLERADAVTDFEPYFRETFPIPTTLTSLPYYGLGINADVHNYIDFENTEYVQMCSVKAYQSGDENNPEVVTDGTTTVYALSAPMRTPITFTDNYIRVGGSGTITFINEHKMAVPSTVLYLTKEASV